MISTAVMIDPVVRVAVVIPIYRHSVLLSEAVESVLAQEAPFGIQLVLVNDGCPHRETEAVCLDYARTYPDCISYLRKPNGGLSDARNHGIRYVLEHLPSVEAIYLLDADNRLRPQSLARGMATLDAEPDLGWIYPNIDMFGMVWAGDYGGPYSRLLHSAMNICEAGSLIRRSVFEAGVFFDTTFKQGFEDWEFFLAAGQAGFRGRNLEDLGFLYRKRPESMLADSEREGAGIRTRMQQKHKAFFQPKFLITLEQKEAPRFAILLADCNEVILTTDPTQVHERLSFEDYDRRYWQALACPSRAAIPPFLVVTTSLVLKTLETMGLLRWSFWRLERLTEDRSIGALVIERQDTHRLWHVVHQSHEGRQARASMIMIIPKLLREVLLDSSMEWINTLPLPGAQPPVGVMSLSVPSCEAISDDPLAETASLNLLYSLRRMRSSKWREGVQTRWDWRNPIELRSAMHRILRNRLESGVAYPNAERTGRDIGFLLPILEFGGVEKVAIQMARAFKRQGFRTHLFVLETTDISFSKDWQTDFDSLNFLSDTDFSAWGGGKDTYVGTEIPAWAQSGKHSVALGLLYWLDVAISFHVGAIFGLMGKLRRLGIQTVASLHLSDQSPVARPVGNTYLALAYEHVFDMFVPCSQQLADWFHAMGVPSEKIVPAPNAPGFDLPEAWIERTRTEREARSPDAPLRVMYLGRLDPQKGLGRLSEVFERSQDLNLDWRIIGSVVIGKEAVPLSPSLAQRLEPPLNTPEELAEAYAWADVVVLLSEYEGLPLIILEAMRQGAVMIATDVGAVSEVLRNDKNGILVPLSHAVDGCLQALERLSADRALLQRLSRQAEADMCGRDWDLAIAELANRLRNLA